MQDRSNTQSKFNLAVQDYLLWMIDRDYSRSTLNFYERLLIRFGNYIVSQDLSWKSVFTKATLHDFGRDCKLIQFEPPIRGLARYLYKEKKISSSLDKKEVQLPKIYKTYLRYYKNIRQVCDLRVLNTRRVLVLFAKWLAKEDIQTANLRIEQLDRFQAKVSNRYATETRRHHRSVLRGLLSWLYQQKIIRRDLAPLIIGAPQYALTRPPRFLRPEELRKLFLICPETPYEKRAWAMLHLACFTGMRPGEISLIRLDDIYFSRQQIILPKRKSANPICIPLPDTAIKAIGDYIMETRPDTEQRTLFLKLRAPYDSVNALSVSQSITAWMRKSGAPGTAYWLRHTYAQNLLEADVSIFNIKEMMGHDRIQTTNRYLRIHVKMMREMLFDETI